MEGYLLMKESGGVFGRNAWNRRWAVLEKTQLLFFDDFDVANDRPTAARGTPISVEGCDVTISTEAKYENMVTITPPLALNRPAVKVRAETEVLAKVWQTALHNAAVGAPPSRQAKALKQHYDTLGLDAEVEAKVESRGAIARVQDAYNALARRADRDQLQMLGVACDAVLASIRENRWLEYSCIIRRTDKGLGLKIVEDPSIGLLVSPVAETLAMISISGTDFIHPGDWLVRVGTDDSSEWPLNRLVHRISPFRLPINKTIQLGLKRRQVASSSDELALAALSTPPTLIVSSTLPSAPAPAAAPAAAPAQQRGPSPPASRSSVFPTQPQPVRSSVGVNGVNANANSGNPEDSARLAALMKEMASLKEQHSQLQGANARLQTENAELAQLLKQQTAETQRQTRLCEGMYRQLQQSLATSIKEGPTSEGTVVAALQKMVTIHSQLTSGSRKIALPPAEEKMLADRGLSEAECKGSDPDKKEKRHLRAALSALIYADSSKQMLEKWELRGASAETKLKRLAERVGKLGNAVVEVEDDSASNAPSNETPAPIATPAAATSPSGDAAAPAPAAAGGGFRNSIRATLFGSSSAKLLRPSVAAANSVTRSSSVAGDLSVPSSPGYTHASTPEPSPPQRPALTHTARLPQGPLGMTLTAAPNNSGILLKSDWRSSDGLLTLPANTIIVSVDGTTVVGLEYMQAIDLVKLSTRRDIGYTVPDDHLEEWEKDAGHNKK